MKRVILDWTVFGVGGHGPFLRVYGSDESIRGWELRVARDLLQDHAVYEGPWAVDFIPRKPSSEGAPLVVRANTRGVEIDAGALAKRLGVELEILGTGP